LTKALVERALGAELSHHLGYAQGEGAQGAPPAKRSNSRNGSSKKRVLLEEGAVEIAVPRREILS